MNFMESITFITGLVQFAVAGYALRLNRLFGVRRVGWSLFWAFSLLALLHLVQSLVPGGGVADLGMTVNVTYALISLLLLISMAHVESVLKERARMEREELRLRAELEQEVKRKTAYLTRAIEELTAEIEGRRQAEAEAETTHLELRAVTRKLESAEIIASTLGNVGDMLKSVDASASLVSDRMKQSKIANVVRIGALIEERSRAGDLGRFMALDPRGRKLPVYIAELGRQLDEERAALMGELESIRQRLEHVREILTQYQGYAKAANLNVTRTITGPPGEACGMSLTAAA